MKQTPLYSKHKELGGQMVDFHGWELPLQYRSITQEHHAVRQKAGLFDVSHMGAFLVQGKNAVDSLQKLVTKDLSPAKDGQAVYALLCMEDGGVIDDLLLYRFSAEDWMLVVNASNRQKDEEWIKDHLDGSTTLTNISDDTVQLALQGPLAEKILQRLTPDDLRSIRFFRFMNHCVIADVPALVSRTGYTGEDGFELYLHASDAPMIWDHILDAGYPEGLVPAGLGARDTLRFEAALPLYGQEIGPDISPLEAGLDRFVQFDKTEFIGKKALLSQREKGLSRFRVGLEMLGRGIPRSRYDVNKEGRTIGQVTSGTYAPSLGKNLAMALIAADQAEIGNKVDVVIRARPVQAQVVALPFYKRKKRE